MLHECQTDCLWSDVLIKSDWYAELAAVSWIDTGAFSIATLLYVVGNRLGWVGLHAFIVICFCLSSLFTSLDRSALLGIIAGKLLLCKCSCAAVWVSRLMYVVRRCL